MDEPRLHPITKALAIVSRLIAKDGGSHDVSDEARDDSGKWTSGGGGGGDASKPEGWQDPGGWEHSGIEWKQPTDPTTGRPIPIKVGTVEEAVPLVLAGKVVEVPSEAHAATLISQLSAKVNEMRAAGDKAADFDLCNVTVGGSNMFCAESMRTAEYPTGVPRLEMPQLGGKPVPGSEADKLPRDTHDPTVVNGADKFMSYLQGAGIRTTEEKVPAESLKASQREIIGTKVVGMMNAKDYDPGKEPIFVSRDNYVVDGHHRWAAVVGRDLSSGGQHTDMNVRRIDAPISEVLHIANAWSKNFGIQQAAGVARQAAATGLVKSARR